MVTVSTKLQLTVSSAPSIRDGTLCRQLSPLPGPASAEMERLRAARAGSPYSVSPRHAVRPALQFHHDRILQELKLTASVEEVLCIATQWAKLKTDYEALLQEPLKYESEAGGDDEVRNALLDLVNPTILSYVAQELVTDALRQEPALNGRGVAKEVAKDVAEWLAFALLQMVESRSIRFFDRAIKRPSQRSLRPLVDLIMDSAGKVGVSMRRDQAGKISRHIAEQLRNPARFVSVCARRVIKVYGSAPLVALRVFLTPSQVAGRMASDANPGYAESIDRAIAASLDRVSRR